MKSKQEIIFKQLFEIPIKNGLFKPTKIRGSGTKMINMGEIFAIDRIFDVPMELVPLTDTEEKNAIVEKKDLVFARSSLADGAGKCSIFLGNQKTTFESHIIRVRINQKIANPKFYYYYFNSIQGKNLVYSITDKTAASGIRGSELASLSVPFPPKNIQDDVVNQLEILDIKIENLKQQNKILEQILQTIFKSWFIDFDGQTEFVDSELGQIPKGWNISTIQQFCDTFGGGTPSTKNPDFWNGDIYWATPSDLTKSNNLFLYETERKITQHGFENCASKLHPKNSILMTSRATIGVFAINVFPTTTNQGFIVIEPKNIFDLYYLYCDFKNRIQEFIGRANGTTFLEISRGVFRELSILVPDEHTLKKFHKLVEPIFNNINSNSSMISILSKTRDSLLPKLMSGEIRV